jgi:transposase
VSAGQRRRRLHRRESQIQALNRTAPVLPILPGVPEKATHDYVRNGTTTLFAVLEVATGKVTQDCRPRHTHADFLAFLKQVAKAYPRRNLHVVCDNYATHKHPTVKAWLANNPRVRLHFTPTSGSWLNLVEIFFGIITRQAIRRGSFDSVKELTAAIARFVHAWNEHCEPFVWTKTTDEILEKALPKNRQTTSVTRHLLAQRLGGGGVVPQAMVNTRSSMRIWRDLARCDIGFELLQQRRSMVHGSVPCVDLFLGVAFTIYRRNGRCR